MEAHASTCDLLTFEVVQPSSGYQLMQLNSGNLSMLLSLYVAPPAVNVANKHQPGSYPYQHSCTYIVSLVVLA